MGITALAGMAAHWRAGRVRAAQGVTFGVIGVAGSYAGSRLSASIRPDLLLALFAVLMLVAAAAMLRRRRSGAETRPAAAAEACGEPLPQAGPYPIAVPTSAGLAPTLTVDRPALATAERGRDAAVVVAPGGNAPPLRRALKVAAAVAAVGLLTGFFGVGGGFVIVPALVLALGFDISAAVGTSLLVIAVNSAAALGARLGGGVHLDWPLIGVFILAALTGALGGNRVASRVSASRLTNAFTILLTAVAVYTLARSLPPLL